MRHRDMVRLGIAWGDIAECDDPKRGIAGHDGGGRGNFGRQIEKHDNVGRGNAGHQNAGGPSARFPAVLIPFLIFVLLPVLFLPVIGAPGGTAAQTPDGDAILRRIDDNMGSDNKITTSEMIIHGRRGSRSITSKSWIRGRTESFTEYLAPPRERGTKMLKLGEQLWTYTPSSDRTILIAGHMLRQSVMGSDLSYEDMMEDPRLAVLYNAKVTAEEEYEGRLCWVLDLSSKGEEIAYFARKVWVDKERFVALKENRYAKSGKLLKTTEVKSVERQGGRWVPTRIVFKDVLKEGEGTEFILQSIVFNADIPDTLFTKASLKR